MATSTSSCTFPCTHNQKNSQVNSVRNNKPVIRVCQQETEKRDLLSVPDCNRESTVFAICVGREALAILTPCDSLIAVRNAATDGHHLLVLCSNDAESEEGVWPRGVFYRFLARVDRGSEILLLTEVRQHDKNLVRHLKKVISARPPSSDPRVRIANSRPCSMSACFEKKTTVVELHEALVSMPNVMFIVL